MPVIQIRGTSGSGKSTVMRAVMEKLGEWGPVYRVGRKQPLYYNQWVGGKERLVLGHYNSPCGGCDTVGSARQVYELTTALLETAPERLILQEGLLLSEDTLHSSKLLGLKVLFLTTPLTQCLEWIGKRRALVGNDRPLNPTNTTNRVAVIERARVKLIEADVYCRRAAVDQAVGIVLGWVNQITNRETTNAYGTRVVGPGGR